MIRNEIDYREIDRNLDMKIKLLQQELKQLKRAKQTRRVKTISKYPIMQYLSSI